MAPDGMQDTIAEFRAQDAQDALATSAAREAAAQEERMRGAHVEVCTARVQRARTSCTACLQVLAPYAGALKEAVHMLARDLGVRPGWEQQI